jgi:hypothetical protein
VQISSVPLQPRDQVESREPLAADEFQAMITTMCGRYGTLRQVIEEMADEQLRELRQMLKASND